MNSIEELEDQSVAVLLYPSGASGEFLGYALTESFAAFTKTHQHWENVSRCKFFDYFNRCLTSGLDPVPPAEVIAGIQLYYSKNTIADISMGLSHIDKPSLNFLKQYCNNLPTIEIVTRKEISKRFRVIAANSKISAEDRQGKDNESWTYEHSYYRCNNQLQVEWADLLLTDTVNTFKEIENFLGLQGSVNKFTDMVADYLERNKKIFSDLNQSSP
jgi:hypothetical protein